MDGLRQVERAKESTRSMPTIRKVLKDIIQATSIPAALINVEGDCGPTDGSLINSSLSNVMEKLSPLRDAADQER